jgi:type II secretory pathway pseudopilin PulG
MRKREKGFSLLESLLSLSLFLIIFLSSLEVFGIARNVFFKLNAEEKKREGVSFALDRMRLDLLDAGRGLDKPIQWGLLKGISRENDSLTLLYKEDEFRADSDLLAGQERIFLQGTQTLKKQRQICIQDSKNSEVKTVISSDKESVTLTSPLNFSYAQQETSLVLLRKITYFLDEKTRILRRRVNASPAQPLLEDVSNFYFNYDESTHLLRLQITLKEEKENMYEISVFPRNMALAGTR